MEPDVQVEVRHRAYMRRVHDAARIEVGVITHVARVQRDGTVLSDNNLERRVLVAELHDDAPHLRLHGDNLVVVAGAIDAFYRGVIDEFYRGETASATAYVTWLRGDQRTAVLTLVVMLGRIAAVRAAESEALATAHGTRAGLLEDLWARIREDTGTEEAAGWLLGARVRESEFVEALCSVDASTNPVGAMSDAAPAPADSPVQHVFSTAQAVHLRDRHYGIVAPRSDNVVGIVVTSVFRVVDPHAFLVLPPSTCIAALHLGTKTTSQEVVRVERQHIRVYDPIWSELPRDRWPQDGAIVQRAMDHLLEQRLTQFPYVICSHVLYRVLGAAIARLRKGGAGDEGEEGAPVEDAPAEDLEMLAEAASQAAAPNMVAPAPAGVPPPPQQPTEMRTFAERSARRYVRTYVLRHEPFWMEPLLATWYVAALTQAEPRPRVPLARLIERPLRADMLVSTARGVAPLCAYAITVLTTDADGALAAVARDRQYLYDSGTERGFLLAGYYHRVVQPADVAHTNTSLGLLFYDDMRTSALGGLAPEERAGRAFSDLLAEPGLPGSPNVYVSVLNAVLADDVFTHREPRPRRHMPLDQQVIQQLLEVFYGPACAEAMPALGVHANGARELLAVSPVYLEDILQRLLPPH
jgi:hypothetical protein